jgi:hypothetical protein
MIQRRWLMVVTAAAMVGLAACARVTEDGVPPAAPARDDSARIERQAHDALDRWDRAVAAAGKQAFVVVGGAMTAIVGQSEESNAENNKLALTSGRLVLAGPLTATAPATATVRWPDGTVKTVHPITAEQALDQVKAEGAGNDCGGCTPLTVTGARFVTVTVTTSRGPATAPAWEFTFGGTAVRVTHVAVSSSDTVTVVPPPWNSNDPPAGSSIDKATVTPDGRHLTVSFVGARDGADKACGADYTARAVESTTAVVIILAEHQHAGNEVCDLVGYARTAPVQLAQPLGARVVLEVREGLPVPVTASR